MNIEINSLNLGMNTQFKIESPIQGLEKPPIRTSSNNYSGRDGGVVTGQFFSSRLITISGFIVGDTAELHEQYRRELQEALPIRTDLDVEITTFAGTQYITTVRVTGFTMPIISPVVSEFKIDLFASDPNLYTSSPQMLQIPITTGGGFILPVVLPITFSAGSSPVIIDNTGTVAISPTFTITGEATNPIITKTDTGEFVKVNVTMGVSDVLVINMAKRTVVLNGSSAISFRDDDSSWFDLDVGINHFIYSTDDLTDTGIAEISWRTAVTSV